MGICDSTKNENEKPQPYRNPFESPTDRINKQVEKCLCKIDNGNGTFRSGFLVKFPTSKRTISAICSSYNATNYQQIASTGIINFTLNNDQIVKNININDSREKFLLPESNIAMIEIIPAKDGIYDFLEVEPNLNKLNAGQQVYILHYIDGKTGTCSSGQLLNVCNPLLEYSVTTSETSTGGPICLTDTQRVIGVHLAKVGFNSGKGTFFKVP